ncbi:hypothetical protein ACWGCP_12950 [Streptomyces niveus]
MEELDVNNFPRLVLLNSYPVETVRARMNELREALVACADYGRVNPYGTARVTTETLQAEGRGRRGNDRRARREGG